ncbi:MAG: dTDP-glucose 4,6-dehydratase [Magnetovibrio sp.]|nr:dTDP-glucose 4,6-dehydratase [Magnetovibrio sp.]|tara:strand:- start:1300 stop:2346 length:1047 start_codon:yes stop_codon:yes gene_type:complete
MKLLVTGGAGFIGSALIRNAIAAGRKVVNVDKLTYASSLGSLVNVANSKHYQFEKVDICVTGAMAQLLAKHKPDAVMHLAAESHVDRSIDKPSEFIQTNIVGTYQLLEATREYYNSLRGEKKNNFRYHHVSTDEVFGSLSMDEPAFTPNTPYDPRSPYSASKAASDHLALSWFHTYELPVVLSNCSNNYGPFQFPEKLIPLMIIKALNKHPLPIYGNGENVRDWLHVNDHATALLRVLDYGKLGESYLVGANAQRSNIDVVRAICTLMDEAQGFGPHENQITFVKDRPGHDHRYAIDATKIRNELDWQPSISFEEGLKQTVHWYLTNQKWWQPLMKKNHFGKRLGLGT